MKIKKMEAIGISVVLTLLLVITHSGTIFAASNVIKFGAPLPLTGPLSPEGMKQKQGYDIWAETANKAGGIKVGDKRYQVEVVYHDYQSNTPRAVQLVQKLITEDKVNFLFSPFGSGATKAASGLSEKYGIPTIAGTAASEAVYDQGYKYLFGTLISNAKIVGPIPGLIRSKFAGLKKLTILARNDLFPLAIANAVNAVGKKAGLDIPFFGKYPIGTMDHASALTEIRKEKPDWIFITGYINDLILVTKQMGELGVSAPVVTMIAGPAYKEFVEACGDRAENITSTVWWHPAARYKGEGVFGSTERYNELFKKKYNSASDYAQASSAAGGVIFQIAIEKAGSYDRKKVRDMLADMNANTFYGPIEFGSNGQISSIDPTIIQIQGAQQLVVYPSQIQQAQLRLIGN
jgi:branched-chain amino acid transport system substrate-binding protein